jgi:large subunit ribosomal protein L25
MSQFVLSAKKRTKTGKKVKALRREGLLPAVLYGAGIESMPIELDAVETSKVLASVGGSTLVDLSVGKKKHNVLVRGIQRDVIKGDIIHVDFLNVAMDVKIRTEVPVELVGEAPIVETAGALLVAGLATIEVEALPSDLPERITVDLSVLKEMDDIITVDDLDLGEGVNVLTSPDEVIANVVYQAEEILEEEEEVLEELIPEELEPELVERGKREEEAEEPEIEEEE